MCKFDALVGLWHEKDLIVGPHKYNLKKLRTLIWTFYHKNVTINILIFTRICQKSANVKACLIIFAPKINNFTKKHQMDGHRKRFIMHGENSTWRCMNKVHIKSA